MSLAVNWENVQITNDWAVTLTADHLHLDEPCISTWVHEDGHYLTLVWNPDRKHELLEAYLNQKPTDIECALDVLVGHILPPD